MSPVTFRPLYNAVSGECEWTASLGAGQLFSSWNGNNFCQDLVLHETRHTEPQLTLVFGCLAAIGAMVSSWYINIYYYSRVLLLFHNIVVVSTLLYTSILLFLKGVVTVSLLFLILDIGILWVHKILSWYTPRRTGTFTFFCIVLFLCLSLHVVVGFACLLAVFLSFPLSSTLLLLWAILSIIIHCKPF